MNINIDKKYIKELGLITNSQYIKLKNSLVFVLGLGGVGGYSFEMLVRAGICNFIIVDQDKFEVSNFNRQLAATNDSLGKPKTTIYKNRALSINENCNIIDLNIKITNENISCIFENINKFQNYTDIYIADCIDDIDAKIAIINYCYKNNIKIISSMGTANHMSTDKIKITDISKTEYCPIAKIIRKKLKEINISKLDVLFIDEEIIPINKDNSNNAISTISYVPSTCGIKIAEYIIKNLI